MARVLAPLGVLATAATVLLVRAYGAGRSEPQQEAPEWAGRCCIPLGGYGGHDTPPVDVIGVFGGGVISLILLLFSFVTLYALRRLRRSRREAILRWESALAVD